MHQPRQDKSAAGETLAREIARLKEMHPSDIAFEMADFSLSDLRGVLRDFPDELVAEVITELPRERQTELLETMRVERISEIIPEMYSDDAADALADLSPERRRDIIEQLSEEEADEITTLLEYPQDTAGGIMRAEVISVDVEATLAEARETIRRDKDQDQESALYIYATDRHGRLQGVLRLRDLLFRDLGLKVREVMNPEVRSVSVQADQEDIANIFRKYNYIALPVVDDFGKLAGLVTSDDVFDVIQEEATEDMQRMVGLNREEMATTPWSQSVRNRLPWLVINLGTAFLAAWVISRFEGTLARYGMLAAFLPIIGGMGGNAGSQTLTIVVRSLALGEIERDEWRRMLSKEIMIGLATGATIGLLVGLISWLWRGVFVIGLVVCLAMFLNMIAAAMAGVLVPIGLRSAKIDPALASSIMVTTVTDVAGFFLFLSLATVALRLFAL